MCKKVKYLKHALTVIQNDISISSLHLSICLHRAMQFVHNVLVLATACVETA